MLSVSRLLNSALEFLFAGKSGRIYQLPIPLQDGRDFRPIYEAGERSASNSTRPDRSLSPISQIVVVSAQLICNLRAERRCLLRIAGQLRSLDCSVAE